MQAPKGAITCVIATIISPLWASIFEAYALVPGLAPWVVTSRPIGAQERVASVTNALERTQYAESRCMGNLSDKQRAARSGAHDGLCRETIEQCECGAGQIDEGDQSSRR